MRSKRFLPLLLILWMCSPDIQAAFMVEAHASGLANENFTGEGRVSIPSMALGTTADHSIFGGSDDYLYAYTPGADRDNFFPEAGVDLGNGDLATGLEGGITG